MNSEPKSVQMNFPGMFLFFWNCVNLFDLISSSETILHIRQGEIYLPLLIFLSFLASLNLLVFNLNPKLARIATIIFCISQILGVLATAPDIPNHRLVAALINLSLIADILKSGSLALSGRFIETAKIIIPVVYGFSFFHKLNSDFLNPETSCSTKFVTDLGQYYSNLNFLQFYNNYIPLLSLVTEGFLATIYFLPRKLTLIAVVLGFVFHSILAIHIERHFFDFSSLMMTLLLLYLPFVNSISLPPKLIKWLMALGFTGAFLLLLNPNDLPTAITIIAMRTRLWFIFFVLISYYACKSAFQIIPQSSDSAVKIGVLNYFLILFILLTGLTPYLGLRTRSALDMYSNLRVEGGSSNHLLIPSTIQLSLLTNDLVEVLELKEMEKFYPWVTPELISPGKRLVRFQLMALMSRVPGLTVKIRDQQGERLITNADQVYPDHWIAPWIMRKMIGFRPVNAEGIREFCQW